VNQYKAFLNIIDEVYPERVRKVLLLGPPRAFSLIWRMILPFIPAETKRKIAMPTKEEDIIHEFSQQGLSLEALPLHFGGGFV
jgi:hypothetical protein